MKIGKQIESQTHKARRWLWDYIPLGLWLWLIYWLSSQPRLVEIEDEVGEVLFFKGAHLVAYAVLLWLWWRALSPARRLTRLTAGAAFLMTVLYALSDEVHQAYVPGRHGRLTDVMIDAFGSLIMIALLSRSKWLRQFPENMWRIWATALVQGSRAE